MNHLAEITRRHTIPAALELLPEKMRDPAVIPVLMSIAWQESGFRDRVQIAGVRPLRYGPAHGLWQFEPGPLAATAGVLWRAATHVNAWRALDALGYNARARDPLSAKPYTNLDDDSVTRVVHHWIAYDDVLAAAFARLLLWTLPDDLPTTEAEGWRQYIAAWRPGKRREDKWPESWRRGHEQDEPPPVMVA